MTWPADYHMHTPLCRHAVGEPTELAARAVGLGLEEIGFSDHSPMPRDDFDDWRMRADQLGDYPNLLAYMGRMYARPAAPIRIAEAMRQISS